MTLLPEFLPVSAVLATECETADGVYTGHVGENCKGEEKVRRFYARFPGGKIDTFYSDSHSDDPLARLAQKSVLVKGERLLDWETKR